MTKPELHILWLTENYYPNRGGMAQSCDRIVHSLRSQGVRIDLIHFVASKRGLRETKVQQGSDTAFPVTEDPAHTLNLLWNHLHHPQRKAAYTHLLVFGGHLPILAGPLFAAWLGLPLITCLRGNDVDAALFMPRRRSVLREALESAAAVCSVSQDKIQRLQKWLPTASFHHTPNGIDLSNSVPGHSERTRAHNWKVANVAPKRIVLGIFGHLKAKKGLDLLIKALDQRGLRERIHLLISGEVEREDWAAPLGQAAIPYTHIPFLDRYELLAWYPACDAVVIPSHYEGMPNILLEAGALGIPIVASRVDGMKDVLQEGEHGFLFHPGELADCREALRNLVACERSALQQMGQELQTLVQENYTHTQEAQRYIRIFLSVNANP